MPGSWEIVAGRKVLVYTLSVETVPTAWAYSFRRLIVPGDVLPPIAGMPFDHARNHAVQQFLASPYQYLFSLDSDMVVPPDTILRLLNWNLPIVSALYCRRSPPHSVPVMIKNGQWVTSFVPGSLVEVDWVGSGALLVHRSVFEKMPPQRPGKPWFDWRVDLRGTGIVPDDTCLSEDFTFCFPGGTWVAGPKVRRIEDVRIGDRVLNHKGSLSRVLDVSCRAYSGEIVTLTANFVREITSTANHRFLVRTSRKTGKTVQRVNYCRAYGEIGEVKTVNLGARVKRWVEAKEIREGDWLYVPKYHDRSDSHPIKSFYVGHYISLRGLVEFQDGALGYKRTRKDALRIKSMIKVTPELCRLIGYYIAEGYTPCKSKMRGKHTVNFAFGAHETEYIEDCCTLLSDIFGAEPLLKTHNGCTRVVVSSRILGRLFSAWGGNGSHNKHLPRFWSRLSKKCLSEMVKGYWRGDGSCGDKDFTFISMSERLVRELQTALLKLNILCGITTGSNKYGTVFRGRIPVLCTRRFSEVVGYTVKGSSFCGKRKDVRETKRHFIVRVRDVKVQYKEIEVYNMKVENHESYTANAVAVHNCQHAKKTLGVSTYVDTSILCKHCGWAEYTYGKVEPLNHAA